MGIEKKNVEWTVANSTMAMVKMIMADSGKILKFVSACRDRIVCGYSNNLLILRPISRSTWVKYLSIIFPI